MLFAADGLDVSAGFATRASRESAGAYTMSLNDWIVANEPAAKNLDG